MRAVMITLAIPALALLWAAPALAAPPEISRQACDEQGGTYSQDRGTRSCATTTTREVETIVLQAGPREATDFPGEELQFFGEIRRIDTVQTQTTRSQRGNGEVTTTVSEQVIASRAEPVSCPVHRYLDGELVGQGWTLDSFCEARGLYDLQ